MDRNETSGSDVDRGRGPLRQKRMRPMRHWLSLLTFGLVLALTAAIGAAPHAMQADEVWCDGDPVVQIQDGSVSVVNIRVGVPKSALPQVAGTVVVTVVVPTNVDARAVPMQNPFFTEQVVFVQQGLWTGVGPIPVSVTATVPGFTAFPTRLTVDGGKVSNGPVSVSGVANSPMTVAFAIAQ